MKRQPARWWVAAVLVFVGLSVWAVLDPRPEIIVLALLVPLAWMLARRRSAAPEARRASEAAAQPVEPATRERAPSSAWRAAAVTPPPRRVRHEAWLNLLLREVPAGLWITDRDLVLTSTQGLGLAAPGVGTARFAGVPIQRFLRARDLDHPAIAAHRRALAGESVGFEQTWGRHVYQVTVGPLRSEDGGIEGVVGVCLAITERVRQEEALRTLVSGIATTTGKECLRSLVRHVGMQLGVRHVCVAELVEVNGRAVVRSRASWSSEGQAPPLEYPLRGSVCEGIEPGELRLVGVGARNRFPEDEHLWRLAADSFCSIGLAGASTEAAGVLLLVDAQPIDQERLERASVTLFAERAAAELERDRIVRALRLSERRLRLLAENIPGVIYLCRDDEHWTTLYLNDGVEILTGHPKDAFLSGSLRLSGLYHPSDAPRVEAQTRAALAQGQPFQLRYRIRHADGGWRWIEEHGVGIQLEGGERYVEGFLADVTGRVEAEEGRDLLHEQVLQSQKLESLGVLAGGIAHEFNNLLANILANAELADREARHDPHLAGALRGIERAAARGGELAAQMLEYAGKGRYAFQRVSLESLLESMRQLFVASAGQHSQVELELEHELPLVLGDPVQLRHVLMSLVLNAAEAIEGQERGGTITLRTFLAEADAGALRFAHAGDGMDTGKYVCIEVQDDGCGLDEATRGRIFDPFFTTKFTGRGLGLAAASGIVRAHGGAISVESAPGRGSTFRLWFPVAGSLPGPEPRAGEEEAAVAADAPPTLLVVDDEEVVRSLAENVLTRAGFRVVTAASGRRAVEIVRDRPRAFRLALVDVSMPGLDGLGTVEELNRLEPELPVVLSSGYGREDQALGSVAVAAFLTKPYRPRELVAKVREVLGSKA